MAIQSMERVVPSSNLEPGFHPVGVHVVAAGKRFLRVIKVEILISFHLNSSFNDFEI